MKNRSRGVTLIELLTAMLVLAILVGLAVPSFSDFAADSRTTAATSDLVTALNVARSEAIRRSSIMVVCASDDLAVCSTNNDWSKGWIVFTDGNGNGKIDGTDAIVQTWGQANSQVGTISNADRAVYNPLGMANLTGGLATVNFNVKKTGCSGAHAKRVVMELSGSIATDKVDCSWGP